MTGTTPTSRPTVPADVLPRLLSFVETTWPDGAGPDPYDALNSALLRLVSTPNRRLRVGWTQLMRHLPWNPRSLLSIRPHKNPKTISLLARAYVRLATASGPGAKDAERRAREYLAWLAANATPGYAGSAWGYSFPWQSSRLWLDRGQPSSVCTAFVAQAFLDAYDLWKEPEHLEVARSAARFLLRDCPRYQGPTGLCISYTPFALLTVHNANILAAATLAQVWRAAGAKDDELREVAERAVSYTVGEQREDGAWYYDGPPNAVPPLIDGFHTGFVLEGLDRAQRALGTDYSESIGRGLQYYQQHLIAADGRPRRTADRADGAVDVRDCAVALFTLHRFAPVPGALAMRRAVLDWTLQNMRDPRGYFYFQTGGLLPIPNRIPYPRWQAWVLLALATEGLDASL